MKHNVLALFAHPDDETMLCGGMLALLARERMGVHYVCATRGEGGETGEPPVSSREELSAVRSAELACAVKALGGSSLSFLDYLDPLVGPEEELFPFEADFNTLVQQILEIIDRTGSRAVITHGSNGEYGHPAHILVHQAAVQAAACSDLPVYTVQAAFEDHPRPRIANQDDPADLVIDVTPVLEQKILAALCHRSQHALFVRRTSKRLGRQVGVPEVIMKVESLHRVRQNEKPVGKDDLFDLLRSTGLAAG